MPTNTNKTASRQGSSIAAGHEHLCGMRHCDNMNWSEFYTYCPSTGIIRWVMDRPVSHFKNRRGWIIWKSKYPGREVGTLTDNGYLCITLHKKRLYAHRIAYEMTYGPIPRGMEIDHINGIKTDNRIVNLRLASHSENKRNAGPRKTNKSGLKGVSWATRERKWVAQIQHLHKVKRLGYYATKEEAYSVYCKAASELHGEFARTI